MNATMLNPFNPQFGKRPAEFIGRDLIINDFLQSLNNPNDPHRVSIITGIRGAGKTAILSDIHQSLNPEKYLVVDLTAKDGMLLDTLDLCTANARPWLGKFLEGFSGFSVGALGFSFSITKKSGREEHGFRYYLTDIVSTLTKKGIPTVFLIDEVHNDTPEMREFITTYQHLVREDKDVALLMAGLPNSVQDVLNDKILTFLRRSQRIHLESIDTSLIELAYGNAFRKAQRSFKNTALRCAAEATKGYPYLIQLLGFYLWKSGHELMNEDDINQALIRSKADLFRNVHDLIYHDLAQKDKEFLLAMSEDDAESTFGDIAARMKVTSGYASRYRQRMIDADIIHRSSYGKVAFSPPYLREYLLSKSRD